LSECSVKTPSNLFHAPFRHLTYLHEAVRTALQAHRSERSTIQFRENQNAQSRKGLAQLSCGLKPGHLRHAKVRKHQVRPKAFGLMQNRQAVAGSPDDFKLPLELEVGANRPQGCSRIIRDDHTNLAIAVLHRTLLRGWRAQSV